MSGWYEQLRQRPTGTELFKALQSSEVDLAACCTRDTAQCLLDLSDAYALIRTGPATRVAGLLLKAVESRVAKERLKKRPAKYLGRCPEPETCSLQMLRGEL